MLGVAKLRKSINLEIGERVRITRISRGFSREELAELLNISTLFLGYIECGQRGMSLTTLQNMCEVLNVSADYILLGKNNFLSIDDEIVASVKELPEEYKGLALDSINHLKKIIACATKTAHNKKEEQ